MSLYNTIITRLASRAADNYVQGSIFPTHSITMRDLEIIFDTDVTLIERDIKRKYREILDKHYKRVKGLDKREEV